MKISKILSILIFYSLTTNAQIKLPRLISDSMILQRDIPLNIWGKSSPSEKIDIVFNQKKYSTIADAQGNWQTTLPPQKVGGPYNMQLTGINKITLKNILIGDVWVCSGQSNMELEMVRLKYQYPDEIAHANNQYIRQFTIPDTYDFNMMKDDVRDGKWFSVNSNNINQFSGVAYFFAKELYKKYKIPIGLINSALGGSPAEAWISEDAIKKFPLYNKELLYFKNQKNIDSIEQSDNNRIANWYHELSNKDEGIQSNWASENLNDQDWKTLNVPGYWSNNSGQNINGSVWFRKEFVLPSSMLHEKIKLELGRIVDADSVFINGIFVGSTSYQYPPRRYELKEGILREGKNSIVVKVISNIDKGGFVLDKKYELTTVSDTIPLSGIWKYKVGAMMPSLAGQTFIRWKPVGLFNAMIAPLIKYKIKGVIWYQGESNTQKPEEYYDLMQTLITDWRHQWKQHGFPFLYVQLANFMEPKLDPSESMWAATRQAQLKTLLVPNTGMAVAIDLGVWNDIHPENKSDVGYRLSLLARKIAYKESALTASGPIYQSFRVSENKVILNFSSIGKGLIIKNQKKLQGFAIAGEDKKYVWANAYLNNNKVIVSSEKIKKPLYVRYAWADNPINANLYNQEGLPASPFTTEK